MSGHFSVRDHRRSGAASPGPLVTTAKRSSWLPRPLRLSARPASGSVPWFRVPLIKKNLASEPPAGRPASGHGYRRCRALAPCHRHHESSDGDLMISGLRPGPSRRRTRRARAGPVCHESASVLGPRLGPPTPAIYVNNISFPSFEKFQHFVSHIQSFMFSFTPQSNQNFIIGNHSS